MSFSAHKTLLVLAGIGIFVIAVIAGGYFVLWEYGYPTENILSPDESQDVGLSGEDKLQILESAGATTTGLSGDEKLKMLSH